MLKSKISTLLLSSVLSVVILGCSSENTPIAEVFLGEWAIYEKSDSEGTTAVAGQMIINFGVNVINFRLQIDDADPAILLNGIVYDNNLYEGTERKVLLGTLKKDDDILRINLEESPEIVYKAR